MQGRVEAGELHYLHSADAYFDDETHLAEIRCRWPACQMLNVAESDICAGTG